jgi:hypothetical protein
MQQPDVIDVRLRSHSFFKGLWMQVPEETLDTIGSWDERVIEELRREVLKGNFLSTKLPVCRWKDPNFSLIILKTNSAKVPDMKALEREEVINSIKQRGEAKNVDVRVMEVKEGARSERNGIQAKEVASEPASGMHVVSLRQPRLEEPVYALVKISRNDTTAISFW